jgi:hypothetical protein
MAELNGVAASDQNTTVVRIVAELLQAHDASVMAGSDDWQFAVRSGLLRDLGATETHLRYLLALGCVEHRVETTKRDSARRIFLPSANGCFEERSCLTLTAKGLSFARRLAGPKRSLIGSETIANTEATLSKLVLPPTPMYDAQRRLLQWGTIRLICFHRPAPEMEAVLEAFQEAGWPKRIKHPPLPTGSHSKARQREVVRRLNRSQNPHLIRFHNDGDGVCWNREI